MKTIATMGKGNHAKRLIHLPYWALGTAEFKPMFIHTQNLSVVL